MAYEAYVIIEGTKQGKFKGESPREAHKEKIAILGFNYEITSPRDIASGQASGKRQHKPITFIKEWGASSPQIFQALTTNEVLKKVSMEFFRTTADGMEEVYHTIVLTNATVSNIKYGTNLGGTEGGSTSKHTQTGTPTSSRRSP